MRRIERIGLFLLLVFFFWVIAGMQLGFAGKEPLEGIGKLLFLSDKPEGELSASRFFFSFVLDFSVISVLLAGISQRVKQLPFLMTRTGRAGSLRIHARALWGGSARNRGLLARRLSGRPHLADGGGRFPAPGLFCSLLVPDLCAVARAAVFSVFAFGRREKGVLLFRCCLSADQAGKSFFPDLRTVRPRIGSVDAEKGTAACSEVFADPWGRGVGLPLCHALRLPPQILEISVMQRNTRHDRSEASYESSETA